MMVLFYLKAGLSFVFSIIHQSILFSLCVFYFCPLFSGNFKIAGANSENVRGVEAICCNYLAFISTFISEYYSSV